MSPNMISWGNSDTNGLFSSNRKLNTESFMPSMFAKSPFASNSVIYSSCKLMPPSSVLKLSWNEASNITVFMSCALV